MKNFVILLHGAPAAGKLTIAKALTAKTGALLLDNHFFNNVVMPYVEINSETLPELCRNIYKIRSIFLDTLKKYHKGDCSSYVFTNVLLDTEDDKKAVKELEAFASYQDAVFIPVELNCRFDALAGRVNTKERAERYKLTDKDMLKNFLEAHKMLEINHLNKISIDVSDLTAEQTLNEIWKNIEMLTGTSNSVAA